MAKGLKQAKPQAGKGKGTEGTTSECGLGKTPIQRAPLLANRLSRASTQGSGRGLGGGVPYVLPLLTATQRSLPFPLQGSHSWLAVNVPSCTVSTLCMHVYTCVLCQPCV